MSNNMSMTSVQIAVALHRCIGEHVSVYWVPSGQHGVFLRLSGRLHVACRQLVGVTVSTMRYSLEIQGGFITFCPGDVQDLSDRNTIITLRA
jgi:hypothetical protein